MSVYGLGMCAFGAVQYRYGRGVIRSMAVDALHAARWSSGDKSQAWGIGHRHRAACVYARA